MSALAAFIAGQIQKQAAVSTAKGKAKYRAYFVEEPLYANYRAEVDKLLRKMKLTKVIVKAEAASEK